MMTSRSLDDLDWPRHTTRLTIRRGILDDADATWPWRRDPRVSEWLTHRFVDEQDHRDRWEQGLPHSLVAGMGERIIGVAKVAVEDGWAQAEIAEQARRCQAELGWVLDPAVYGQGLGTELATALLDIAFDGLGVRRVVAYCFADNLASRRIMEKIGMRLEGHYRSESLHRSGRWLDGMTYALLAAER